MISVINKAIKIPRPNLTIILRNIEQFLVGSSTVYILR